MVTQDEAMVECIKRLVKVNKKCSANPSKAHYMSFVTLVIAVVVLWLGIKTRLHGIQD